MKSHDLVSIFARSLLGGEVKGLGLSYLNNSQNNCVAELLRIINVFGGALLADPVGSGKTRIAIATALRNTNTNTICVIAPARTRHHWISEARKCGLVKIEFFTHAFLSQNTDIKPISNFIVVDEAHRFRNPKAKRSIQLKNMLETRSCVLVSATPFVNRERDLNTLIRYFLDDDDARKRLGIDPEKATQADLKSLLFSLCVRRGYFDLPELKISEIRYEVSASEVSFLETFSTAIESLHFEALRNEWPVSLVRNFLSKQFQFGLAALRESLISIKIYCEAWISAADQKLGMNRVFFRNAFPNGQLPFSFMYPDARSGEFQKVKADLKTLNDVLVGLTRIGKYSREEAIVSRCSDNKKTLVFTARIAVAESLFSRFMRENRRVGMVHSQRSIMSGIGEVDPREVLGRFRQTSARKREKISVLIATDCLSEGISFPNCSNLILVDTPETAVRVEQRIGRIARLDSVDNRSKVYRLKPVNLPEKYSGVAQQKSKRSSQLGFRYALAAELLGDDENQEDPFSLLLECREILGVIGGKKPSIDLEDTTYFLSPTNSALSSLTLVRFSDGDDVFSYHWAAIKEDRITTSWSDIRESILQLADENCELETSSIKLSTTEGMYFDKLLSRRNLTRLLPSRKQKSDSLCRQLERKISGFAVSEAESVHLYRVLFSPLSRGRRIRFQGLIHVENAIVLDALLAMEVPSVGVLIYEVVFSLRFRATS